MPATGKGMESAKGAKGEGGMREFVLVKNEDGSGELLLRVANIVSVEDFTGAGDEVRQGKAYVVYRDSNDVGQRRHIRTASTAAEVLAAIEGAQEPAIVIRDTHGGVQWHHSGAINLDRQDGLVGVNASIAYRETDSGPKQYVVGFDMGRAGGDTGKRFVIRGGGSGWRVYNTLPLEGDDGCDGIFITRERAEEYAASREREMAAAAEPGSGFFSGKAVFDKDNSCLCTNFAGQNDRCPKHGSGTAWHDLHRE